MLNVDAHNDNIPRARKMSLAQYTSNLRGVCKDGSSVDERTLASFYERVCRHEWAVEERRCGTAPLLSAPLPILACRVGGNRAQVNTEDLPSFHPIGT